MRSSMRSKTHKKPYRHRINKKKYKNKLKGSLGWNDDISGLFLNDINEVLRKNKARRAVGKGSWKVVPKDSCEVYKDRRNRSEASRRKQPRNEDVSSDTENQMEVEKKHRKKPRKRQQKKKVPARKVNTKTNKNKKRTYETSQTSNTTTTSSSSTISEMDYE